jgi:hypothetical protein
MSVVCGGTRILVSKLTVLDLGIKNLIQTHQLSIMVESG